MQSFKIRKTSSLAPLGSGAGQAEALYKEKTSTLFPNPSSAFSPMPASQQNNAPATDAALMERIGKGDRAAFTVLVDRHLSRATYFVMRHIPDRATAEDLVQDGFFKVWQHADRWEPQAQFTTWFYKLLYHACVDHWRKNRRPMDNIDDFSETIPDQTLHPEASMIDKQQKTQLSEALAHLPETQRTALLLFHNQELSQNDIAAIMNVSVGAVESLLFRARQKLKTLLSSPTEEHSSRTRGAL